MVRFLRKYPVQFRRQYQIGCYYVDLYCYQANLAVEMDGSQHTEPAAINYDEKRTQFLEEKGMAVLGISNLDIGKNFNGVCEKNSRGSKIAGAGGSIPFAVTPHLPASTALLGICRPRHYLHRNLSMHLRQCAPGGYICGVLNIYGGEYTYVGEQNVTLHTEKAEAFSMSAFLVEK